MSRDSMALRRVTDGCTMPSDLGASPGKFEIGADTLSNQTESPYLQLLASRLQLEPALVAVMQRTISGGSATAAAAST